MTRVASRFRTLAVVALGGAALLAGPALAQDGPDCNDAQTTADMVTCADRDYKAADKELNEVWRTTLSVVEQAQKLEGGTVDLVGKLRDAQRAWIAFRDAECALEAAQVAGGTMEPVVKITCLHDLTTRRTADLKQLAKDFGPN